MERVGKLKERKKKERCDGKGLLREWMIGQTNLQPIPSRAKMVEKEKMEEMREKIEEEEQEDVEE